jgi:hypothetical protein
LQKSSAGIGACPEMPMQPPFPQFTVVALPCGEHATPDLDARRPMRALLEVGGEGS